jgi:AraC-like DNA-binding protein
MTITLKHSDFWELYEDQAWNCIEMPASSYWEETCQQPELLGNGHLRVIGLSNDICLFINTWEDRQAHTCAFSEREHEVEIVLEIPARRRLRDSHYTLFGSGIAPQEIEAVPAAKAGLNLAIGFEPELLRTLFANTSGELPPELQSLIRANEWQLCLPDRKVTAQMQTIIQQIVNCPYQGLTKQMYLQAKVFELLALQIELLQFEQGIWLSHQLAPATIESVYEAKAILIANLEHPPLVLELAQMVGVSDRTLRRGFQHIFGTTVIGFLTDKRLEQAERLLREPDRTVAEVAGLVGYARSSRFAEAFKGKFGITPRECLAGKKSVLQ